MALDNILNDRLGDSFTTNTRFDESPESYNTPGTLVENYQASAATGKKESKSNMTSDYQNGDIIRAPSGCFKYQDGHWYQVSPCPPGTSKAEGDKGGDQPQSTCKVYRNGQWINLVPCPPINTQTSKATGCKPCQAKSNATGDTTAVAPTIGISYTSLAGFAVLGGAAGYGLGYYMKKSKKESLIFAAVGAVVVGAGYYFYINSQNS